MNNQPKNDTSTDASNNIPQDAEESASEWCDSVIPADHWAESIERDRIENEHDAEMQAWHDQEVLQREADHT